MNISLNTRKLEGYEYDYAKQYMDKYFSNIGSNIKTILEKKQNGYYTGLVIIKLSSRKYKVSKSGYDLLELLDSLREEVFKIQTQHMKKIVGHFKIENLYFLENEKTRIKQNILVIDDDIDSIYPVSSAFEKNGAIVNTSHSYADALVKINKIAPDIVVCDWMLGDKSGSELLEEICQHRSIKRYGGTQPFFKLITYTAHNEKNYFNNMRVKRVFQHIDHWQKPIGPRVMFEKAKKIINEI